MIAYTLEREELYYFTDPLSIITDSVVEYSRLKGEPVPGFNISNQKFHQKLYRQKGMLYIFRNEKQTILLS